MAGVRADGRLRVRVKGRWQMAGGCESEVGVLEGPQQLPWPLPFRAASGSASLRTS